MSTQPGVTIRPVASISRRPLAAMSPTALILSPSTATSARLGGAPVPSTTMPPRMTRSCIVPLPLFCPTLSQFRSAPSRRRTGAGRRCRAALMDSVSGLGHSMSMSLAVIIQNYRRPQNIGRIVRAAREALPDADIFLLDQADEDLRGRDDIPWGEVWFQRAEVNRGAGARAPIAARMGFDHYIAIDDDPFLPPAQIRALAEILSAEPDRVHGIWGQRLEFDQGRLSMRSDITRLNAALSIVNLAYAFSRTQAVAAIELSARLGFDAWPDLDPIDDLLLSCASAKPPLCHDLGPTEHCPTSVEPGIATWKLADFSKRRLEIARKLLAIQSIAVFSPMVIT